jgi:ABC-type antimicrobial peptide transport system permease subunit
MSVANPPKPGPSSPEAVASLLLETPRRDLLVDAWYRLLRNKASVIGMIIIAIFTITALFANFIAPQIRCRSIQAKAIFPRHLLGLLNPVK